LEWCIAPPADPGQQPIGMDLDMLTIPSFNTAHAPATAQPSTQSTVVPLASQVIMTQSFDTQDDLTMASTVNTRLLALEQSCALLPLIMKQLDAIAPPLSSSSAPGSTSTLAVSSTPSTQLRALGGRD